MKAKRIIFTIMIIMAMTTQANAMFSDVFSLVMSVGKVKKQKELQEQRVKLENEKLSSIMVSHSACLTAVSIKENKSKVEVNRLMSNFHNLKTMKEKKTIILTLLKRDQYFLKQKNKCLQNTYKRVSAK
jgi:hypothetical protein